MQSRHQDQTASKIISDLLGKVFYEDARYFDMLCRYLTESSAYVEVVRAACCQIKSLKRVRQEHLEKASSQITSMERGGLQNISEFMAVDIDLDLEALQKSLTDQFRTSQ